MGSTRRYKLRGRRCGMGKRCDTVTCSASKKNSRGGTGLVLGSLFGVLRGAIRIAGGAPTGSH